MAKLTRKKFEEYKAINENGFTVDFDYLMYWGRPKLSKTVYKNDNDFLEVVIGYFEHSKVIDIRIYKRTLDKQFIVTKGGDFARKLYEEDVPRFSFKRLKELATLNTLQDLIDDAITEYSGVDPRTVKEVKEDSWEW